MEQTVKDAIVKSIEEGLQRAILSNAPKTAECTKVKIHPVIIGGTQQYQIEEYKGTQVFHKNCTEARRNGIYRNGFPKACLNRQSCCLFFSDGPF